MSDLIARLPVLLHYLRNSYGVDSEETRRYRLEAADLLESQAGQIRAQQSALEMTREWAESAERELAELRAQQPK